MSYREDETTMLRPYPASNKIFDLPYLLSLQGLKDNLRKISKKQFYNDIIVTILSLISLTIIYFEVIFIQTEEFYREDLVTVSNQVIIKKKRNTSNQHVTILRLLNIIFTLIISNCYEVFFITRHYIIEVSKLKLRKSLTESDNLKSSGLLPYMLIEIIIMGICCPPYLDYEFSGSMLNGEYIYSADAIISIISMLRLLQIMRIYIHSSMWMSFEAFSFGKKLLLTPNLRFSLKADLRLRPQVVLFPIIGTLVVIMGWAISTVEKTFVSETKSSLDFSYLTNGFWLAIVTMCTIGYGDGYPSTHLGRAIIIIAAALGLVAISLYIVTLGRLVHHTNEESKAYYLIKSHKKHKLNQTYASNIIKSAFALKSLTQHKSTPKYIQKLFLASALIKTQVHHFSGTLLEQSKYLSPTETIMKLDQKLNSDIIFMKKEILDILYIRDRLDELIESEEHLSKRLEIFTSELTMIEDEVRELNIESYLKSTMEAKLS